MMNPNRKKQASVLSISPLSVIDLGPLLPDLVSPQEFLEVYESAPDAIKTADIVPPQLGRNGFGGIRIQWKSPLYGKKCPS